MEDDKRDVCTLDEVADKCNINAWTIRLWCERFNDILKPCQNENGEIFFSHADMEKLKIISRMAKVNGMKAAKVKEKLKEKLEDKML